MCGQLTARMVMFAAVLGALTAAARAEAPVPREFTYQGHLKHAGVPISERADFQFSLWDLPAGGAQIGATVPVNDTSVSDGLFTVSLDFGTAVLGGRALWLEIAVRVPPGGGAYTTLSPRQPLTPTPFASLATKALDARGIGGNPVSEAVPTLGGVLKWDGSTWGPGVDEIGGYLAGGGLRLEGNIFSLDLDYADGRYVRQREEAGGDLAGEYPDPRVAGLCGRPVSFAAPAVGRVLKWDGSSWGPGFDEVGNYLAGTGLTLTGNSFSLNLTYADGRFVNEAQAAGGDLAGTYPNPSVAKVQGRAVSSDAPGSGQVLKWDGSQWDPAADGLTLPYTGTTGGTADGLTVEHTRANSDAVAIVGRHDVTNARGTGLRAFGGYAGVEAYCSPHDAADTTLQYFGLRSYCQGGNGSNFGIDTRAESSGKVSGLYAEGLGTGTENTYGVATYAGGGGTGIKFGVWAEAVGSELVYAGDFTATGSGANTYGVCAAADGSGTTYGVVGVAGGSSGGVKYGVYGSASNTGAAPSYGVYGWAGGAGTKYAGYFNGNLSATGAKTFQIDHPLDPENSYLNHYSAEGPEPLNVYRGTAVLKATGAAQVQLPAYFEAINRDFSYQLTAIGAAMPNLHVAGEIQNNSFTIAGGKAGGKVSWEVKGVRNDAFMRQHGAPVEQPKSPEERGKYLYPELFGAPQARAVHAPPGDEKEPDGRASTAAN